MPFRVGGARESLQWDAMRGFVIPDGRPPERHDPRLVGRPAEQVHDPRILGRPVEQLPYHPTSPDAIGRPNIQLGYRPTVHAGTTALEEMDPELVEHNVANVTLVLPSWLGNWIQTRATRGIAPTPRLIGLLARRPDGQELARYAHQVARIVASRPPPPRQQPAPVAAEAAGDAADELYGSGI